MWILILLIICFIGFFLSAPLWISYLTKTSGGAVIENEVPKSAEERIIKEKKEEEGATQSIFVGILFLGLAILGVSTGTLYIVGKGRSDAIDKAESPEEFLFLTIFVVVLGLFSIIYGYKKKRDRPNA